MKEQWFFLRDSYISLCILLALAMAFGCSNPDRGLPLCGDCSGPIPSFRADFESNTLTVDPFADGDLSNIDSVAFSYENNDGKTETGSIALNSTQVFNLRWDSQLHGIVLRYYDQAGALISCHQSLAGDFIVISDIILNIQKPDELPCKQPCTEGKVENRSTGSLVNVLPDQKIIVTVDGIDLVFQVGEDNKLVFIGFCNAPENMTAQAGEDGLYVLVGNTIYFRIEAIEAQNELGNGKNMTFQLTCFSGAPSCSMEKICVVQ